MYSLGEKKYIDVAKCLGSGQNFHWKQVKKGYVIVDGNNAWYLKLDDTKWEIEGALAKDLYNFFDLQSSYGEIFQKLQEDLGHTKILEEGEGLRLLKQDPWEVILGFILSTNNNIGRIQKSIFDLSQEFGKEVAKFEGEIFYALPRPQVLANLEPQILRQKAGAGYRDKYLVESARMIYEGKIDLDHIKSLNYQEALKEIMKLPGVGKKAGDCILLFGFGFSQSFPVDVWVERIMQEVYGPFKTRKEISDFGSRKFGTLAGFVQQLFFYYVRSRKSHKRIDK